MKKQHSIDFMHNKGFTLVELSIVIVIIGFIIAGVTAGKSLVENAKLRSSISWIRNFDSSFITFKLVYNALPGDMVNANSYWTGAAVGDGDKKINCIGIGYECWKLWQHMDSLHAGLIPGVYNGNDQAPSTGGSISMRWVQYASSVYTQVNKHWLLDWSNANATTANSIDTKIDDGIPTHGIIITWASGPSSVLDCVKQSDGTTNATTSYTGIGQYNLAQITKGCSVHYKITN